MFNFAWQAFWRDFKSGELAILATALVVAVGAISAVGLFTDRVSRGMERQASDILAADLIIRGRERPGPELRGQAEAAGLRTAERWSFASVIVAGDDTVLANVRAVDDGYPLRGQIRTALEPFGEQVVEAGIPTRGTVWLDTRLFAQLGASVGDTVSIGASTFVADRVLEYTPDQGFGFTSFAPTALMNLDDVAATDLIRPGSRVNYRLLLAGDANRVDAFGEQIQSELPRGLRTETVREERPELAAALDRAARFLGLAAVVSVLLAAVAVAMAARRHASRHLDAIAILKCMGASQSFVIRAYALQLLFAGVIGSVLGVALGWLAQAGLVRMMAGLLSIAELPAPAPMAAFIGVATGVIVLVGFALPPLLPLRKVSPARVLRRDLDPPPLSAWIAYGSAAIAVGMLLYTQTRDLELTAWVAAGVAVTTLALVLGAMALVSMVGRLRSRVGVAWRYGVANIARRRRESIAQIVAFGLGIMVLLLLAIVRTDLMSGWRDTLPDDAPNHFIINIQTEEVDTVRRFFSENDLIQPVLFPMVRGRLTHINEQAVETLDFNRRAQGFVDREANLSWAEQPQPDNRVVAGRWWTEDERDAPMVSVEVELAERLDVGLGDTLTYDIAGESLTVTITSLRTVEWDSFNPNFFLQMPPGTLEGLPANWITAFYLPDDRRGVLLDLMRVLPSITVIDINAIVDQVRGVIDQASRAVEFVFIFTLLAGVTVMLAAISASRDERLRESAMLRTFGAPRGVVLRGLGAEFVTLGALAGLLGAIAASGIGWILAREVFDFQFGLSTWVWSVGLLGGGLGIGTVGLLATRRVLNQSPLLVLRQT